MAIVSSYINEEIKQSGESVVLDTIAEKNSFTHNMNCNKTEKRVSQHTETVCWGYEAENGPNFWVRLSPEYRLCGAGIYQSPIDIVNPTPAKLPPITFNDQSTSLNIRNTGNTIEVLYPKGSWIEVDGTKYHLLQFHFHAPSEHTVAGNLFDMEMPFVHESEDNKLAVIGVLIVAEHEAYLSLYWFVDNTALLRRCQVACADNTNRDVSFANHSV